MFVIDQPPKQVAGANADYAFGLSEKPSAVSHRSSRVAQLFSLGIIHMKQQINRPIISRGSPVVPILAALTMLGLSIYTFSFLMDEVRSGWTYSLGVVFDNTTKIYRSSSPIAFWVHVGFFMSSCVLMIALAIFTFVGLVIDHKRKVAAAAKEKAQHDA
jgi:hypothetical protein